MRWLIVFQMLISTAIKNAFKQCISNEQLNCSLFLKIFHYFVNSVQTIFKYTKRKNSMENSGFYWVVILMSNEWYAHTLYNVHLDTYTQHSPIECFWIPLTHSLVCIYIYVMHRSFDTKNLCTSLPNREMILWQNLSLMYVENLTKINIHYTVIVKISLSTNKLTQ